ncbi:hypothetical protein [Paraburkholderia sediminicola]|uniref:hypothetical protein n=1 Tax=Paraburkholderia sediminicola TaxID=458836 RepID=UPI0038B9E59F
MSTDTKFTREDVVEINSDVMRQAVAVGPKLPMPKLSGMTAEILRRTDFSSEEIVAAFEAAREHIKHMP